MRGVQKVRSLTQLTTRYAHHILSLFNIDTCKWNAFGPAFLQCSDTIVEELLFLVFQPAICHAIRTRIANTVSEFKAGILDDSQCLSWRVIRCIVLAEVTSICFLNWKNSWKDTYFLTMKTLSAWQMAGWKTENNNSSTTESELWRNAGPSAF